MVPTGLKRLAGGSLLWRGQVLATSRPLLFPKQCGHGGHTWGSQARAVFGWAHACRRQLFPTRFLLAQSRVGFRALSGPGDVTARAHSPAEP